MTDKGLICVLAWPVVLWGAATLMPGSPAWAETRQALVIADRTTGQEPGQPARDALDMSQALLAAGFDVRRLENPASLPAPGPQRPDVMLIYVSGDLTVNDDGPAVALSSGPVGLEALSRLYPAARQQIVVIETCPRDAALIVGKDDHPAPAATAPGWAPGGASLLALSPAEGAACGASDRLTARVLAALAKPGAELSESLGAGAAGVMTGSGWSGFTALAPIATPAPPPAGEGGLTIGQTLRPVDQMGAVTITAPRAAPVAAAGSGVQIFAAAAPVLPLGGDRAARPTAQGLPEPSIIIGNRPDPQDATAPDTLAGTPLGGSYEERRRIREDDPARFASLLDSGAFDPADDQIASVIQTELQRMNCYGGTVDGVWGNGSRQAVDRYFQVAGDSPVAREPEAALFRQIALKDDLRCAAATAQPAARTNATTPARQGTTTQRRATRPAAQTPTPTQTQTRPRATQPPPATSDAEPRINPNTIGSGVFR